MPEPHVIHCIGNREFHLSRQGDGNILCQIVMGNTGEVIANPVLPAEEAEKMSEALDALLAGGDE